MFSSGPDPFEIVEGLALYMLQEYDWKEAA
jgi:hypothetical protein